MPRPWLRRRLRPRLTRDGDSGVKLAPERAKDEIMPKTIREYEETHIDPETLEADKSEFMIIPWACSACEDAIANGDPLGEGHGGCSAAWLDHGEPIDIELVGGSWKALIAV